MRNKTTQCAKVSESIPEGGRVHAHCPQPQYAQAHTSRLPAPFKKFSDYQTRWEGRKERRSGAGGGVWHGIAA